MYIQVSLEDRVVINLLNGPMENGEPVCFEDITSSFLFIDYGIKDTHCRYVCVHADGSIYICSSLHYNDIHHFLPRCLPFVLQSYLSTKEANERNY